MPRGRERQLERFAFLCRGTGVIPGMVDVKRGGGLYLGGGGSPAPGVTGHRKYL